MIADDVDPTLCSSEPVVQTLDDGFSPPPHESVPQPAPTAEPALPAGKSAF